MSKQDKLIATLEAAANAVTPGNGGPTEEGSFDTVAALVEVSYRIGRALTLARSIARESK